MILWTKQNDIIRSTLDIKQPYNESGQTRQPPDVQDLEGKKHEESVLLQCLSCEEHSRYKTVRP